MAEVERAYAPVLQRAFQSPAKWYGPYDSFDHRYDYVLYVQHSTEDALRRFFGFLADTLLVDSMLDEAWALAHQ